MKIAEEAIRILKEVNSARLGNLKSRISLSLFAQNDVLQLAVQEFTRIVESTIVAVTPDGMDTTRLSLYVF